MKKFSKMLASSKPVCLACLLMLFLVPSIVPAQENQTNSSAQKDFLRVSLSASLVVTMVDEKGVAHESLQPLPDEVYPGNIIQYTITAINTSTGCPCSDTLKNTVVLGAIPKGTVYIEKSATSPSIALFSIDGGVSYHPWPVSYTVKNSDGTETVRMAAPDQYTGIQWSIASLAPQERLNFSYQVRVQ